MKRNGCKPYHKYRTQKLLDNHKWNRVQSAKAILKKYGKEYREGRSWARLVNTDFSAKIKITPSRNSKNDVVWALSRGAGGDTLNGAQEKFSLGEMIWGGICSKGLVPSHRPIFVSELAKEYEPQPKTVDSKMYADLIRHKAGPAIDAFYPNGDCIFQDDNATIHRSRLSLKAVEETFENRLDPKIQASKMADIYPIENVWSIVKTKVDEKNITSLAHLKREITSAWKEIDQDKELCKKMMASIPKRLESLIKKRGGQIFKTDY